MSRIEEYFDELRNAMTDSEIAAGLTNGDIEKPSWLSISESADHLKAWDNETNADSAWGFVQVPYKA